jgi:hypothetical protein
VSCKRSLRASICRREKDFFVRSRWVVVRLDFLCVGQTWVKEDLGSGSINKRGRRWSRFVSSAGMYPERVIKCKNCFTGRVSLPVYRLDLRTKSEKQQTSLHRFNKSTALYPGTGTCTHTPHVYILCVHYYKLLVEFTTHSKMEFLELNNHLRLLPVFFFPYNI